MIYSRGKKILSPVRSAVPRHEQSLNRNSARSECVHSSNIRLAGKTRPPTLRQSAMLDMSWPLHEDK